jgi:hypothetical protein
LWVLVLILVISVALLVCCTLNQGGGLTAIAHGSSIAGKGGLGAVVGGAGGRDYRQGRGGSKGKGGSNDRGGKGKGESSDGPPAPELYLRPSVLAVDAAKSTAKADVEHILVEYVLPLNDDYMPMVAALSTTYTRIAQLINSAASANGAIDSPDVVRRVSVVLDAVGKGVDAANTVTNTLIDSMVPVYGIAKEIATIVVQTRPPRTNRKAVNIALQAEREVVAKALSLEESVALAGMRLWKYLDALVKGPATVLIDQAEAMGDIFQTIKDGGAGFQLQGDGLQAIGDFLTKVDGETRRVMDGLQMLLARSKEMGREIELRGLERSRLRAYDDELKKCEIASQKALAAALAAGARVEVLLEQAQSADQTRSTAPPGADLQEESTQATQSLLAVSQQRVEAEAQLKIITNSIVIMKVATRDATNAVEAMALADAALADAALADVPGVASPTTDAMSRSVIVDRFLQKRPQPTKEIRSAIETNLNKANALSMGVGKSLAVIGQYTDRARATDDAAYARAVQRLVQLYNLDIDGIAKSVGYAVKNVHSIQNLLSSLNEKVDRMEAMSNELEGWSSDGGGTLQWVETRYNQALGQNTKISVPYMEAARMVNDLSTLYAQVRSSKSMVESAEVALKDAAVARRVAQVLNDFVAKVGAGYQQATNYYKEAVQLQSRAQESMRLVNAMYELSKVALQQSITRYATIAASRSPPPSIEGIQLTQRVSLEVAEAIVYQYERLAKGTAPVRASAKAPMAATVPLVTGAVAATASPLATAVAPLATAVAPLATAVAPLATAAPLAPVAAAPVAAPVAAAPVAAPVAAAPVAAAPVAVAPVAVAPVAVAPVAVAPVAVAPVAVAPVAVAPVAAPAAVSSAPAVGPDEELGAYPTDALGIVQSVAASRGVPLAMSAEPGAQRVMFAATKPPPLSPPGMYIVPEVGATSRVEPFYLLALALAMKQPAALSPEDKRRILAAPRSLTIPPFWLYTQSMGVSTLTTYVSPLPVSVYQSFAAHL